MKPVVRMYLSGVRIEGDRIQQAHKVAENVDELVLS